MRIFYAADRTPNAAFDSNLWWYNLYLPLVDMGHDVVAFDYDLRETLQYVDTRNPQHQEFIAANRPRVTAALLDQVRTAHAEKPIDLFFSYFYDACVEPATIDALKAMGISTVNFFCNASYQLYLVEQIAPHYDWCLVPERFRLDDYRAIGANPIYCQMAANPDIYKPTPGGYDYDVAFVGQAYGDRPNYIRFLLDSGIPVDVWGPGWEAYQQPQNGAALSLPSWREVRHKPFKALGKALSALLPATPKNRLSRPVTLPAAIMHGRIGDEEMIALYSRAKINLGFSTCGSTHLSGERIVQVRLRDFEVPMSGGFYMVEYIEELEAFYEIGREIVCYRDPEDLGDKIRYYLSHDAEREKIRQAGYERCRRDHTWQRRFEQAFTEMGMVPYAVS